MRFLTFAIIALCLPLRAIPVSAAEGDLTTAQQELALARTYKYKNFKNDSKFFFHATGTSGETTSPASYQDLIEQFLKPLEADPQKRPPQALYRSAISILTALVTGGDSGATSELLRDALAEYIEGETLVGNQNLIDALRSRFPSVNASGMPTESLKPADLVDAADAQFLNALDALQSLRSRPDLFRDGDEGPPGQDNPFGFVMNSRGEQVLNELKLVLGVAERKLQSGVTRGKLLFNESAKGTGSEKNRRADAALALKAAGQEGYLWLATAAALHHSPTAFSRNGAGEIRADLATAERVFQMIRRGENPDGYVKDFIPSKPIQDLYGDAVSAVVEANADENMARHATRDYDNSLQVLRSELGGQRAEFKKPLERLSGLRVTDTGSLIGPDGNALPFAITTATGRAQFMAHLRTTIQGALRALFEDMTNKGLLSSDIVDLSTLPAIPNTNLKPVGDIGIQLLELRAANLELVTQIKTFKDYPERIRIEEERVNSNAVVIDQSMGEIGAKQIAMGWANSTSISVSGFPPSVSVNFSPGSIISGYLQRDISDIQGKMQIKMEQTNSAAVIKNLLVDQARAFLGVQQSQNRVVQAQALLENMLTETERLLEDWANSKEEAAEIYYRYPTFRIEQDQAIQRANLSFQRAREVAYFAAKALEYEWVEAFSNPIGNRGSGLDVPLKVGYEQFVRIESLFGAKDTLELRDFLKALYDWHDKLSTNSLRGNPRGNEEDYTDPPISFRQHILGYSDEAKNQKQTVNEIREKNVKLFQNWMGSHTQRDDNGFQHLLFEFSTEIDTRAMFARDEWNQKILRIGVGFRGGDLGAVNPKVQLTQGGTASLRRYPPIQNIIERKSLSGLGTKELSDVLTKPAEERTYVKLRALLNPSVADFKADPANLVAALQELSVAADRWTFHLDMSDPSNKSFPLDEVSDIVFMIHYTFNHPALSVGQALRMEGGRLDGLSRQ